MELAWNKRGWDDYLYWQITDKLILKRINELIKDCLREPFDGIGKPEPLKENFRGSWSRRINDEHRLIYKVSQERITILQCRFHY